MGRLIAIPGFAGDRTAPGFAYDANSALQQVKTDNGITMQIPGINGRDRNGRLKEMLYTDEDDSEILCLTYDYDKANNIVRRNDNTYVYDELNRLQKATIYGAFEDKLIKVIGTRYNRGGGLSLLSIMKNMSCGEFIVNRKSMLEGLLND